MRVKNMKITCVLMQIKMTAQKLLEGIKSSSRYNAVMLSITEMQRKELIVLREAF